MFSNFYKNFLLFSEFFLFTFPFKFFFFFFFSLYFVAQFVKGIILRYRFIYFISNF
jgi:hypothetical protein